MWCEAACGHVERCGADRGCVFGCTVGPSVNTGVTPGEGAEGVGLSLNAWLVSGNGVSTVRLDNQIIGQY